jgi:hypothetical protein
MPKKRGESHLSIARCVSQPRLRNNSNAMLQTEFGGSTDRVGENRLSSLLLRPFLLV